MIRFRGHWDGRAIVLDEPVELENGKSLEVTVERADTKNSPHSSREALLELAREAARVRTDLPPDFSVQHDHYLYGVPKQ